MNADVAIRTGIECGQRGQLDQAIAHFKHAIELKPDYAEAHGNLAHALFLCGRYPESIEACRVAISLKRTQAEVYGILGNSLRGLGHLDEAIAAYLQAIAFRPS